jgi:hypothetical protein
MNLSVNASIPLTLLISEIYLNFKFSGSPFRSKTYEKKTSQLNKLLAFWAILRIV